MSAVDPPLPETPNIKMSDTVCVAGGYQPGADTTQESAYPILVQNNPVMAFKDYGPGRVRHARLTGSLNKEFKSPDGDLISFRLDSTCLRVVH